MFCDRVLRWQEMREIQKESSGEIMAEALEVRSPNCAAITCVVCGILRDLLSDPDVQDNIFEWHFAIRGPPDTEFEVPNHLLAYAPAKKLAASAPST